MEISKKSWHYKALKSWDYDAVSRMETWPNEYSNLCYYLHMMVSMMLALLIIAGIISSVVGILVMSLGSTIYWVWKCLTAWEFITPVEWEVSGIMGIGLIGITYLAEYSIRSIVNQKGGISNVVDILANLTGKYCTKITIK